MSTPPLSILAILVNRKVERLTQRIDELERTHAHDISKLNERLLLLDEINERLQLLQVLESAREQTMDDDASPAADWIAVDLDDEV